MNLSAPHCAPLDQVRLPDSPSPEIQVIINRSATLHDRLSRRFVPDNDHGGPIAKEIEGRLRQWKQSLGNYGDDILDRRLSWDGFDLQSIQPLLGPVKLAEGEATPSWALFLQHCLRRTAEMANCPREDFGFVKDSESMPFEEVFLPFVAAGFELLKARTGSLIDALMPGAQDNIQLGLLARVTAISSSALDVEYRLFRQQRASLWHLEAASGAGGASREVYGQFVTSLRQDGLTAFLGKYAALGRLVGVALTLWLDSLEELITRLERDRDLIAQEFAAANPPGRVERLHIWLSDRHHGGRTVMQLAFESGIKVIYKPKCIALEKAFANWLKWLADNGVELPFRPMRVLSMEGYGWVECVAHRPCQSETEAKIYYQRAGMLLCLAHSMEATDCHYENLIADGDQPQWIDLETLMQCPARSLDNKQNFNAPALANTLLAQSVLRTLLLPNWMFDSQGNSFDVSGLASQSAPTAVPTLRNMNTDHMFLSYEAPQPKETTNQPCLPDGRPLPAGDYVEELVGGFRKMYRFLMDRRELLSTPDGPLKAFARQRLRFVLRPSRVYGLVMKRALKPEFLRDGIDRSIQIDAIALPFARFGTKLPSWGTVEADHRSLELMDVPYYSAVSDNNALYWMSGGLPETAKAMVFPDYLTGSGFKAMLEKIRCMSKEDCELQEQFIRSSFYAYQANAGVGVAETAPASLPALSSGGNLNAGELIAEAELIGRKLAKTAIRASDGSAAWIGMNLVLGTDRYQFQAVGDSLFTGSTGIALFLAALAQRTGNPEYRDLALAAVQPIRATLSADHREWWARELGGGGFSGVPSVAYGLAVISSLLGEPSLLDDALRTAECLTPELIARDNLRDVVLGGAGAALALIALHDLAPHSNALNRAIVCGEKLLRERVATRIGARAWNTIRDFPLTGFSHGAAGIAYVLFLLGRETGQERFSEAAAEGVAFERSVFMPDKANWPDLRFQPDAQGRLQCMTTWCHGASGIALSRLEMGALSGRQDLTQEAEVGMNTTALAPSVFVDHLCCGKLGRALILRRGASVLNRPDWQSNARALVRMTIDSAREEKNYALFWKMPRTMSNPGLMQGMAGIGYSLLQFAEERERKKSLPELLLLKARP